MNKERLYNILLQQYFKGRNIIKLNILSDLSKENKTYMELKNISKISMPLLSYHLNGNKLNMGLIELGLIEKVYDNNKQTTYKYKLTELGKNIVDIFFSM